MSLILSIIDEIKEKKDDPIFRACCAVGVAAASAAINSATSSNNKPTRKVNTNNDRGLVRFYEEDNVAKPVKPRQEAKPVRRPIVDDLPAFKVKKDEPVLTTEQQLKGLQFNVIVMLEMLYKRIGEMDEEDIYKINNERELLGLFDSLNYVLRKTGK